MKKFLYEVITGQKKGLGAWVTSFFLWVTSMLYRCAVVMHRLCARKHVLKGVVISVGNITWGGTGKTPLVENIARACMDKGRRVAILSRGYMKKDHDGERIIAGAKDLAGVSAEDIGDEPYMLAQALGDVTIGVGIDRFASGKKIEDSVHPDVFILDDGFQHWALCRNIDVVAIDATNPFGNGHLIPRGILREPLSALRRADIMVITKTDANPCIGDLQLSLAAINPRALVVEAQYRIIGLYDIADPEKRILNIAVLKGKGVVCLSSIASPASFEEMLTRNGVLSVKSIRFPDHHRYASQEVAGVFEMCHSVNAVAMVTTEKDAVRLKSVLPAAHTVQPHVAIYAVKIVLEIKQDEAFFKRLSSVL